MQPCLWPRITGPARFQRCGTALRLWDRSWPDLVHPHAGATDTELPPPSATHVMPGSKPAWVEADVGPADATFGGHPDVSLAEGHRRNGQAS